MGKETVEQSLARIGSLRSGAAPPEARRALSEALGSKTNLIAAKAADVVVDLNLEGFGAELAGAFARFMSAPPAARAGGRRASEKGSADKGCVAKTAIARALYKLGDDAGREVFPVGVRHVQTEAAYGPPVDVAAELRGTCALGLVRVGHRDALAEAADLLMDREPLARVFAARALGYAGREEAALPLRVKLLAGDAEADVFAEGFAALLSLTPGKAVPFVARFLDHRDDAVRDAAALALGASRRAEAFEVLSRRLGTDPDPYARKPLLLAIGMLRLPEAIDFLLSRVSEGGDEGACESLEALHLYRGDPAVRSRAEAAVSARGEATVRRAFEQWMGR